MVKFYSNTYSYDYNFPAVSLAYFLRYPNPYSRHVASTDTIERFFDPDTQRLTTVRLHVKQSRLPPAVLKVLPKSAVGSDENGRAQSFILEKSVVDVRQGWMETESKNLDWNNVLQRWGDQATASSVAGAGGEEEPVVRQGWFSSWSSGAVRAAVESISLQRTERSQPKAQLGMSVVLDRLRQGGIQAVLEAMEHDRELAP
ncbi:hypothetical protein LTR32_006313 [Rachicladosporium monterosium]|uniref:PRELI/MSF1 domain-containing protein n=1 Tax=Rachicladosporium monterosium TaxID=1507873 RepID=A0ABR0L0P7_9PEZI|nr:hypothetical protein LTR32_006313 [Rachicladosporium monterosium]